MVFRKNAFRTLINHGAKTALTPIINKQYVVSLEKVMKERTRTEKKLFDIFANGALDTMAWMEKEGLEFHKDFERILLTPRKHLPLSRYKTDFQNAALKFRERSHTFGKLMWMQEEFLQVFVKLDTNDHINFNFSLAVDSAELGLHWRLAKVIMKYFMYDLPESARGRQGGRKPDLTESEKALITALRNVAIALSPLKWKLAEFEKAEARLTDGNPATKSLIEWAAKHDFPKDPRKIRALLKHKPLKK